MKKYLIFILFLFLFLNTFSSIVFAENNFSTKPVTNNGKKWRIGYLEG